MKEDESIGMPMGPVEFTPAVLTHENALFGTIRRLSRWFSGHLPVPVVQFKDATGRPAFFIGLKWSF